MGAADNILKNFALFVDGRGLAGNCEELSPPKLALITEDFKAGGLDSAIKVRMGQEPMEASFTLTKFDPNVLALWGVAPGNPSAFVARGAVQSLNGVVQNVVEYMRGEVREMDPGQWTPQGKATLKFVVDVTYYRKEQDGKTVHEIDVPNMKRIVNGVDSLAAIRAAIGLA